MPAVHHYSMVVELCYSDAIVNTLDTEPILISPLLSIAPRLYPWGQVLASALETEQKIGIPFEGAFKSDHLFFAVTIVRNRDGKCKRIFQFPSPSESQCDFSDKVLLFDCPLPNWRSSAGHNWLEQPCGLQIALGMADGTRHLAYDAESVEMYSYGDDGELWENGIWETLLRIEYAGIWF